MTKINPAALEASTMCKGCTDHSFPKINELIDLVSDLQKELADLKGAGKKSAPKAASNTPKKKPAVKKTTRRPPGGKPKSLGDVNR